MNMEGITKRAVAKGASDNTAHDLPPAIVTALEGRRPFDDAYADWLDCRAAWAAADAGPGLSDDEAGEVWRRQEAAFAAVVAAPALKRDQILRKLDLLEWVSRYAYEVGQWSDYRDLKLLASLRGDLISRFGF